MTVPAKTPVHMEAALVGETSNNVLDGAGQDVTVVGQACSKGRAIVEGVSGGKQEAKYFNANEEYG